MNKHPFSQAMLEATKQAIRTTGVTKTQIAAATGNGNPWVTKLLEPVLEWLKGRKGALFPKISKESSPNLSYHFKALMKRAGVPDKVTIAGKVSSRSFHSLRHSFSTWLAEADIHPDVRRKLTGHATADAHALYTHHDEALEKAIKALPRIVGD